MQDPIKLYNPTALTDFQSRNPLIDWSSLLNSLVTSGITTPSTIIDKTPDYYERLNTLLSSGNVKLQTLQEYFVILYVMDRIYSLDSTSRAAHRKMIGEISSGISTEKPRWRLCVGYTSNTFSNSLGRYYTLKNFGSENERKKAEVFLTTIHKAWLDRLPNIDWLDDQTRAKALEKVYYNSLALLFVNTQNFDLGQFD
jgi:predicted metalloendopeptidase